MTIMNEKLAENIYNCDCDLGEMKKSLEHDDEKIRNNILRSVYIKSYRKQMNEADVAIHATNEQIGKAFDFAIKDIDEPLNRFGIDDFPRLLANRFCAYVDGYENAYIMANMNK